LAQGLDCETNLFVGIGTFENKLKFLMCIEGFSKIKQMG
jgi:hypothetical protein